MLMSSLREEWHASVFIQEVEDLETVPDWLDGTPIMVRTMDGSVIRGCHKIFKELKYI